MLSAGEKKKKQGTTMYACLKQSEAVRGSLRNVEREWIVAELAARGFDIKHFFT
jgi:hypothetical protein